MSQQLHFYSLPYTRSQPPAELVHDVETASGRSDTTAFNTGLDTRDVFSGKRRCVICGEGVQNLLEGCHIIRRSDFEAWNLLEKLEWMPSGVKGSPEHESRNGLVMCCNHHKLFDGLYFFIRFQFDTRKYFLFIYDSFDTTQTLLPFHGKAIALNINHPRAPLPLFFLVHEYMVRGRNFYRPGPNLDIKYQWQDWILDNGVLNDDWDRTFNHDASSATSATNDTTPTPGAVRRSAQLRGSPAGLSDSQMVIMPPTADFVEELKAFQRTIPSWKAWERETISWEGTAEENTQKYIENIGVSAIEQF